VVVATADLLALSIIAAEGMTSLFVPVFLGVLLTYIFGALYLFRQLMDYERSWKPEGTLSSLPS
jgi:flagellar biosynthesis protein FliQ